MVSHRAVEEVKKDLHKILHRVDTVPFKQHDGQQLQVQQLQVKQPGILQEEDASIARSHLKAELKALLSANNGCTKDREVVDIIAKLSECNPCPNGFSQLDCFPGDYSTLSAPNFPGRIKTTKNNEENIKQYTLGRLSFNIFQPNELICTMKSIQNPVHPQHDALEDKDNGTAVFSYHLIVDLTIHTPDGDLEATLINRGFCRESEDRDNRMKVTFTGGTLIPGCESTTNDKSMLALWEKTFANAYERANKERSFFGRMYQYCLILFLGLILPKDSKHLGSSRFENAFHFDMKRPPKGFFDVLYLDDDMRITKGNRGTVTVLERASSNAFSP
jgi:hypothetical protein